MVDPFTNEYIHFYNPLKGLFLAPGKQDFQAFAPSHLFLKRTLAALSWASLYNYIGILLIFGGSLHILTISR